MVRLVELMKYLMRECLNMNDVSPLLRVKPKEWRGANIKNKHTGKWYKICDTYFCWVKLRDDEGHTTEVHYQHVRKHYA